MNRLVSLNRKGFTLIEVIVVAAIIAILAGILVPMIFNQIDESKKARAVGDCKSILAAITDFGGQKNTQGLAIGKKPVHTDTANCDKINIGFLYSDAASYSVIKDSNATWVTAFAAAAGNDDTFKAAMTVAAPVAPATNCYNNKEAIAAFTTTPSDPWGNAYIANSSDFKTKGAPVWILSAGPNGVIDTDATSETLNNNPKSGVAGSGDDVGIRWQ